MKITDRPGEKASRQKATTETFLQRQSEHAVPKNDVCGHTVQQESAEIPVSTQKDRATRTKRKRIRCKFSPGRQLSRRSSSAGLVNLWACGPHEIINFVRNLQNFAEDSQNRAVKIQDPGRNLNIPLGFC